MTTIAYRDGILAADTRMVLSGHVQSYCHKIHVIDENRVMCGAGNVDVIKDWKDYLCGERKTPPKRAKDMEGIFITDGKVYCFDESPILVPIEKDFHAEGTGWLIAFAAMHMGLSAVDAVKVAGELDINTNTLVDYYDVETKTLHQVEFPRRG